jgi:AcrR family transcriptional regulator
MTSHPIDSTRDVILAAAIGVVERANTSDVTLDEVAAAAGVDTSVASEIFGSVDDLLIEAALGLAADDLRLDAIVLASGAPTVSAYAHHFAKRRVFYRAMRFGPVTEKLDARMAVMVAPLILVQIRALVGPQITDELVASMAAEATVESFEITNRWMLESADTDGPETLYVLFEALVIHRLEIARSLHTGS